MTTPSSVASNVQIRRATLADAEACGHICYQAFSAINRHHNFPPDFPAPDVAVGRLTMMFSHPGFYGVAAEGDGKGAGDNCLGERDTIAGLGPITVDPATQNGGVGRALMRALLDRAATRGFAGVRLLQAAFHSRSLSLYTKLGFDAREPMSVMQGRTTSRVIDGCA